MRSGRRFVADADSFQEPDSLGAHLRRHRQIRARRRRKTPGALDVVASIAALDYPVRHVFALAPTFRPAAENRLDGIGIGTVGSDRRWLHDRCHGASRSGPEPLIQSPRQHRQRGRCPAIDGHDRQHLGHPVLLSRARRRWRGRLRLRGTAGRCAGQQDRQQHSAAPSARAARRRPPATIRFQPHLPLPVRRRLRPGRGWDWG